MMHYLIFLQDFQIKYFLGGINGNINLTHKLQIEANPSNATNEQSPWDGQNSFYMNVIKQDYPSLFLWQQLVKIIITSSSLLLEKDYVTIQSNNNLISVSSIADFEIEPSTRDQRDDILYQPQGNLKYLNFKNSGKLQKIDINMYYQDKSLILHPVMLPPNFFATLKLKFIRRKAFNLLQHDDSDISDIKYNK